MSDRAPVLYFDLGSPYAYFACERAVGVLGVEPELEPILLGAMFARRGSGSWGLSDAREAGMAEVEARAARYGLPTMRWPQGWPGNGLAAMRCALWAKHEGAIEPFVRAVFRAQFTQGAEITDHAMLARAAASAGLDPEQMRQAIERPELKQSLRECTDAAWDAGVRGVPSLRIGETVYYGDDQLELAARAIASP